MIKVSAGLSRKIGEANYSSRGGSVHLEQEFDAGVIHEPNRLCDGIRELFALARQALDEELGQGGEASSPVEPHDDSGASNGPPEGPRSAHQHPAASGSTVLARSIRPAPNPVRSSASE